MRGFDDVVRVIVSTAHRGAEAITYAIACKMLRDVDKHNKRRQTNPSQDHAQALYTGDQRNTGEPCGYCLNVLGKWFGHSESRCRNKKQGRTKKSGKGNGKGGRGRGQASGTRGRGGGRGGGQGGQQSGTAGEPTFPQVGQAYVAEHVRAFAKAEKAHAEAEQALAVDAHFGAASAGPQRRSAPSQPPSSGPQQSTAPPQSSAGVPDQQPPKAPEPDSGSAGQTQGDTGGMNPFVSDWHAAP